MEVDWKGGGKTMKVVHRITDAEREVMEVLWRDSEAVQTRVLLELMKEKGKSWKRQTLNTILFRLEERGIVSRKRAYVQAAMSREALLQAQTREILEEYYGGKAANFFAAFIGNPNLTPEDIGRLDALLEELKNK